MGRPSLNVKQTAVRLQQADLERIDALKGANQRAKFIREAVKEKLAREEGQGDAVSNKQSNNSSSD
ncbi:hypothetical protein [Leisingera sp. M523]|uniref:hypothetical protein n=1 Tax=Leisingera sp. M523 TaxID=2867013 RepID=UPI0021A2CE36|nr:hypothetical protein [Leisingera sp. M523]UWQ29929.1 hypothetical protein K3557_05105 [Leisingera sp. M523]